MRPDRHFVRCPGCGGTGQVLAPNHHRCPQCVRVLPGTEFYRPRRGRARDSWCKDCRRKKARLRYYWRKRAAGMPA